MMDLLLALLDEDHTQINSYTLKNAYSYKIGRGDECEIQIEDKSVSNVHCSAYCQDGAVFIQDEGSSNGTYVNGQKVTTSSISVGDLVQVGMITLKLKIANMSFNDLLVNNKGNLAETETITEPPTERKNIKENQIHYIKENQDPTFSMDIDSQTMQRNIRLLHEVGKLVNSSFSPEELLQPLLRTILMTLKLERGSIFLQRKPDDDELLSAYCHCSSQNGDFSDDKFALGRSVVEKALQRSIGTISSNIISDEGTQSVPCQNRVRILSVLCVPMKAQEGSIGALYFDSLTEEEKFKKPDLDLLTALGRQAALAIQNKWVEQELIEQERSQRIQEQKAVEMRAEMTEKKYFMLVENIPDAVWSSDQYGNIRYLSPNIETITGYTSQEIELKFGFGFGEIHPEDEDQVREGFMELFSLNKSFDLEYRIRRKNDKWIWVHNRASSTYVDDGFFYADGVLSDVTQRRRYAEELQRSNRELQSFANIAAHDLQEPLRKLQVFGSRLENLCQNRSDEQVSMYVHRMVKASQRMQDLVGDLLEFCRVDKPGTSIKVDLTSVIEEVLDDLEVRIDDLDAKISVEIEGEAKFYGEKIKAKQILQNLLSNALKFHRKGVAPSIQVQVVPWHKDSLKIEVRDNGIGFEEKYLSKIFDVFQCLHSRNEYEGSGIGLTICRKIVEQYKGTITAQSVPGEGTKFIVILPLDSRELIEEYNT